MHTMYIAEIDEIEYEVVYTWETGWILRLDRVIEIFERYSDLKEFVEEQGGVMYTKIMESEEL